MNDIETKSWGWVGTGSKLHNFINGQAMCRSSYKQGAGQLFDFCEAKQYGAKQYGVSVCGGCETKFNAMIERLENSMQASTGEGDYLPPAKEEETVTVKTNVTPEMIEALRLLRKRVQRYAARDTELFNILDDAGIFAVIDGATGSGADPDPVSKCTCGPYRETAPERMDHRTGCPGDPAEQDDMARTTAADNIRKNIKLAETGVNAMLSAADNIRKNVKKICTANCRKRGFNSRHATDCAIAKGEPVSAAVALTIGLNR